MDRRRLGAIYSAFVQNLMSIPFIAMLVGWNNAQRQSMYIASFKWFGTLAFTPQSYGQTDRHLVVVMGLLYLITVLRIYPLYTQGLSEN